jgi:hypothetical protein
MVSPFPFLSICWHPIRPLVDRFGERLIYDSELDKNTKVNILIDGQDWK